MAQNIWNNYFRTLNRAQNWTVDLEISRGDKPGIYPGFQPGVSFQAVVQENRTQVEGGSLFEQRKQRLEFRAAKWLELEA